MNAAYLRAIYLRLAGVVTLVVFIALLVNAYLSQRAFETALAPQMAAKVASVGASMRALVSKAVDSGVDFDQLFGVTASFDEVKEDSPEITSFALTDDKGSVRHRKGPAPLGAEAYFSSPAVLALLKTPETTAPHRRVGDQYIVSMPIVNGDTPLGVLHMGVDVRFFDELVLDMMFDVIVVLVVALFFTLELLHFIAGAKLEASLRELGATFERGASGNFAAKRRERGEQTFGSLLQLMDATLARVNNAYGALAREIEASRCGPAHERAPGLVAAQAGLQALADRKSVV